MATVRGYTAERMLEIENETVVSGSVNGAGDLTLVTREGTPIVAGNVKGPKGDTGDTGDSATISILDTDDVDLVLTGDPSAGYTLSAYTKPLPYASWRTVAAQARSAGAWAQVINMTSPVDTAGPQPWSMATGLLTINEDGLYSLSLNLTTNNPAYAIGFRRVSGSYMLSQTPVGAGSSLGTNLTITRRFVAGDAIILMIYPTVAMNIEAESNVRPCNFSVVKLSR